MDATLDVDPDARPATVQPGVVQDDLDRTRADERIELDAPDEALAYQRHCNQQAVGTDHHAVGVLRRVGYAVDPLDSSCCGMAGSFGYEAEHHDLSRAIAAAALDVLAESDAD